MVGSRRRAVREWQKAEGLPERESGGLETGSKRWGYRFSERGESVDKRGRS